MKPCHLSPPLVPRPPAGLVHVPIACETVHARESFSELVQEGYRARKRSDRVTCPLWHIFIHYPGFYRHMATVITVRCSHGIRLSYHNWRAKTDELFAFDWSSNRAGEQFSSHQDSTAPYTSGLGIIMETVKVESEVEVVVEMSRKR